MLAPISTTQPTVMVVGFPTGQRRLTGAGDLLTVMPPTVQDTGANIPQPVLYDQFGRGIFEVAVQHGTFTNALTLGYLLLV